MIFNRRLQALERTRRNDADLTDSELLARLKPLNYRLLSDDELTFLAAIIAKAPTGDFAEKLSADECQRAAELTAKALMGRI